MKQTKAVLSIFLGGLLTIASIPANAILVLELSTDNATLQVRDNELYKDFSAKEGKISHLIEDFDGWDINTTGLSNPYIGTHAEAELDLNSIAVSGGSGTLTIKLTNTFNTLPTDGVRGYATGVGGTTDGTVSFQSFLDNTNTEFGENILLADSGELSGLSFSSSKSGLVETNGFFSITTIATITHADAGQVTSFDYAIKVPEPSTIAILGLGLLVVSFFSARNKKI